MSKPAPHIAQISDFIAAVNADSYQRPDSDIKNLPVSLYTDPDRLSAEQDRIFTKAPVIIGHVAMIPRPGDHFTFDHLSQPLLVVRGKDEQVRVFYNICRHRGVRLVNTDSTARKPSFVCPYHNWTYGLDGDLVNIPCAESFTNEDVSGRGLKPVPSAVSGGFIFASLDPDAEMKMSAFLGEIITDFETLGLPGQYFFDQTVRTKKCNWKLVIEAFQDGYHVVRLHRNTVGHLFMDNVADIGRVKDHLRAIVARNDFAAMRETAPADWDMRNQVSLAFYIYPNTVIVIHPDYISHLGVFPTATDECICVHSCFIDEKPETEKAQAHFERAFKMIDEGVFDSEDFFVCEQAQIGMKSGVNDYFPLSEYEIGLKLFHEILNEKLGA